MRLLQFRDVVMSARMERRRRQHQNRTVDEQRERQRDGGIQRGEADRLALFGKARADGARQHGARMQEQVMRHHCRAENSEREVEHLAIREKLGRRQEPARDLRHVRARKDQLPREGEGDDDEQRADERFEPRESKPLQRENQEHVERRESDAEQQRNPEQKLQADRRADHFGQISGDDRGLSDHPKAESDRAGIAFAAQLREIAPRRQREPGG